MYAQGAQIEGRKMTYTMWFTTEGLEVFPVKVTGELHAAQAAWDRLVEAGFEPASSRP